MTTCKTLAFTCVYKIQNFSLSFEGIVQGRFEICGHDIIDEIVKVGAIDEPLSLVARVHGSPAELVIRSLSLHEAPHRTTHHRNRLLVWHNEKFSCLIYVHSLAEELTCKGANNSLYCMHAFVTLDYINTWIHNVHQQCHSC